MSSSTIPAGFEDLRGRVFQERYSISDLVVASAHRVVLVGTEVEAGRPIVLVMVRPGMLHDAATFARFERRVRAGTRVRHPAIGVPIDSGETLDGALWLVFERPEGEPLDLAMKALPSGRLPWAEVRSLLLELVRGLAAAHARKVVHGGLSPSSCWVHGLGGDASALRVLELGANADPAGDEHEPSYSRTTTVGGDPVFMAPETAGGIFGDERSDVYVVGLVAWFMLVGRPPFQAGNAFQLVTMHLQAPVPAMREAGAGVPSAAEAWVRALLAKEPGQRPASMSEVEQGLLAIDELGEPRKVGAEELEKPRGRRGRAKASATTRDEAIQGEGIMGPAVAAPWEPNGTVVLTALRAEPREGAVLDATVRLGNDAAAIGLHDATQMLTGAELAGSGAFQPSTMVLGPEPVHERADHTATVALNANATMLVGASSHGPEQAPTMLLSYGAADGGASRAESAGQGATTVLGIGSPGMQAAPARPMVFPSPQAPPLHGQPAGPSVPAWPMDAVGRPEPRSRLGSWLVILTLLAAVAGVAVGLLLGDG